MIYVFAVIMFVTGLLSGMLIADINHQGRIEMMKGIIEEQAEMLEFCLQQKQDMEQDFTPELDG